MEPIDPSCVYKEICENIRETDRISFTLLSLVPTASGIGAGILTFLQYTSFFDALPRNTVHAILVVLALAGATISFGLYKWELRNIQKCSWLVKSAADLETEGVNCQFKGWSSENSAWGKTQAEKLIYRIAIALWLIPIFVVVAQIFPMCASNS